MTDVALSEFEKYFILTGIEDNYRTDGRSCLDYRPIELETNIISHAVGSARIRLANSDILVCVKCEIDCPNRDTPEFGKIEFFVDCSANATPEFEGRGGEELAVEIAETLSNAYEAPQTFDYKSLSLVPGQQCWKLFVDVLILECGGNLFDAVSLAVKSALFNTKLPRLTAALLDGEVPDLLLSDDPLDCTRINVDTIPLLITACKIGNCFIVDPTAEEEECGTLNIVFAICQRDGKEYITNIHACGDGSFQHKTLMDATKFAISAAKDLNKGITDALKIEEEKYNEFGKKLLIGFTR